MVQALGAQIHFLHRPCLLCVARLGVHQALFLAQPDVRQRCGLGEAKVEVVVAGLGLDFQELGLSYQELGGYAEIPQSSPKNTTRVLTSQVAARWLPGAGRDAAARTHVHNRAGRGHADSRAQPRGTGPRGLTCTTAGPQRQRDPSASGTPAPAGPQRQRDPSASGTPAPAGPQRQRVCGPVERVERWRPERRLRPGRPSLDVKLQPAQQQQRGRGRSRAQLDAEVVTQGKAWAGDPGQLRRRGRPSASAECGTGACPARALESEKVALWPPEASDPYSASQPGRERRLRR
ncbi:collagen alpha-1(I) chain-like [Pan troglodytes]|uniref:collagen alpha-1(I) chain-like n=1 Tax=Pan troglodytes TaxID=9598 RepID=UPI003014007B